jgi:hypothetical protein
MNKQQIDNLKRKIDEMESLIESQKQLINRSLKCLAQTKASLAVTRIVKKVNGESLSVEEQQFHDSLIIEAYETASKQMLSLGKMEAEQREMENELLLHE